MMWSAEERNLTERCLVGHLVSLEGSHVRYDLVYYFSISTCHFTTSTCLLSTFFQSCSGLDSVQKKLTCLFCVTNQLYISRDNEVLEDLLSMEFISNPLISLKLDYPDLVPACGGMGFFFLSPRCYLALSSHCWLALQWFWERHWISTLFLPVK